MVNRTSAGAIGQPAEQHSNDLKEEVVQKIKDERIVSVPENVLFQQLGDLGGEVVLLDIQNGGYFGLNEVGSRIWSLIQDGKSVGAILVALLEEYDISEESLRDDVEQFLTNLRARGLIEINENHAG